MKLSCIFAVIIWAMWLLLLILSRREAGDLWHRPFLYIYKKGCMLPFVKSYIQSGERQIVKNLISLHPGGTPMQLLTEYYVEKLRLVIGILLMGSMIAFGTGISGEASVVQLQDGAIHRGEETDTVYLEAVVKTPSNVVHEEFSLEVKERLLREEEAEELQRELIVYLDEVIRGTNPSLTQVRENLLLPDQVKRYPFWINWNSSDTAFLGNDGAVTADTLECDQEVILQAEIHYGEWEWNHSWQVVLLAPMRSPEEQLAYELQKNTVKAAEDSLFEEKFLLPDKVGDNEIAWHMKEEDDGRFILLLTLVAAIVAYGLKDRDLKSDLEKRKEKLREAYPELVSKYALLLGAGMTVRGAFQKICKEYSEREKHPLYEEMSYACNELQAGVSESKVYENFGLRTGVGEYTRLCTLLNQNLKKGSSTLIQRLRAEYEDSLQENRRIKRRKGEEAGTRLLLPMVMMLLMVLLMIMLPAFSGVGA